MHATHDLRILQAFPKLGCGSKGIFEGFEGPDCVSTIWCLQACRSPAGVCAGRLYSQQPLVPRSVLMQGRSLPAVGRFAAQAAATAEAPTEQSFEYQAEVRTVWSCTFLQSPIKCDGNDSVYKWSVMRLRWHGLLRWTA